MGVAFLLLAILTCGSALVMLWTRKVLHAALALFMSMLGLAGLYVLAYADVMAVSHLMIYVGGVLILLLFGIMMTNSEGSKTGEVNDLWTEQRGKFWAIGLGLTIFFGLLWLLGRNTWAEPLNEPKGSKIISVGIAFLTDYSFAFELTGIFLLIALVGATYIAKNDA